MQLGKRTASEESRSGEAPTKPLKVIVVGPYRSGKSSLIRTLAKDSLSVERLGSSISLDFGRKVVGSLDISLFGAPGRKAFSFMRKVLGRGANLYLLVLDSTDSEKLSEVRDLLEGLRGEGLPIVVAANKQDLKEAMKPKLIKGLLQLEKEPVMGTSAETGHGLDELVKTLMKLAKEGLEHE